MQVSVRLRRCRTPARLCHGGAGAQTGAAARCDVPNPGRLTPVQLALQTNRRVAQLVRALPCTREVAGFESQSCLPFIRSPICCEAQRQASSPGFCSNLPSLRGVAVVPVEPGDAQLVRRAGFRCRFEHQLLFLLLSSRGASLEPSGRALRNRNQAFGAIWFARRTHGSPKKKKLSLSLSLSFLNGEVLGIALEKRGFHFRADSHYASLLPGGPSVLRNPNAANAWFRFRRLSGRF